MPISFMARIAKGWTNPLGFEPALATRMRSPAFWRRTPSAEWLRHEFPVHIIRTKGFYSIMVSAQFFLSAFGHQSISASPKTLDLCKYFYDCRNIRWTLSRSHTRREFTKTTFQLSDPQDFPPSLELVDLSDSCSSGENVSKRMRKQRIRCRRQSSRVTPLK